MKDRLLKFINYKGVSQRQFLLKAGLSTSYLSVVKDDFGVSALFNISQNFPELNIEWLKTGKGEMLNKGFENNDNNFDKLSNFFFANGEQKPIITESIAKIPNIDVLELVKSGKVQNLEYMGAFNQFPPFDFYFRNDRVSMEPQFMRGDLIALSALQENAVIHHRCHCHRVCLFVGHRCIGQSIVSLVATNHFFNSFHNKFVFKL